MKAHESVTLLSDWFEPIDAAEHMSAVVSAMDIAEEDGYRFVKLSTQEKGTQQQIAVLMRRPAFDVTIFYGRVAKQVGADVIVDDEPEPEPERPERPKPPSRSRAVKEPE